MFAKLLIANRGEIACRIARTARRLGIRTVAVVFRRRRPRGARRGLRRGRAHRRAAAAGSYLRGDVILEAARRTGARPSIRVTASCRRTRSSRGLCARRVTVRRPVARGHRAMGSKSAAKALMEKAGVPLTPGYHGDRQEPDYLLEQARRIGFPVLIKAVSGGGGKGMRRVDAPEHSPRRSRAASARPPRVSATTACWSRDT
jgi:3-methylcrotonyl-CoA carboxylase alpha subunit